MNKQNISLSNFLFHFCLSHNFNNPLSPPKKDAKYYSIIKLLKYTQKYYQSRQSDNMHTTVNRYKLFIYLFIYL